MVQTELSTTVNLHLLFVPINAAGDIKTRLVFPLAPLRAELGHRQQDSLPHRTFHITKRVSINGSVVPWLFHLRSIGFGEVHRKIRETRPPVRRPARQEFL